MGEEREGEKTKSSEREPKCPETEKGQNSLRRSEFLCVTEGNPPNV